jgi:hypothetical protein
MKRVKIYLRSVEQNGEKHLAMFDSNHIGAIDDLITDVHPGDEIIWKLDCLSGIKSITRIYRTKKKGDANVFKYHDPRKRLFCKGFKHHVPMDVKVGTKEEEILDAYAIEYIPWDSEVPVTIDPYIRIPPPN